MLAIRKIVAAFVGGAPVAAALAAAVVAPLVAAAPLAAQQPARANFYLIVGADTVSIERVERTPSSLRFDFYDLKGGTRIQFAGGLSAGALVDSASTLIYATRTDTAPALRIGLRFVADSVGVRRNEGAMNWVRTGAGALPSLNVSGALLEQSLLRARAAGGDSVSLPLFFMPSGPVVPVTIVWRGANAASVQLGGVTMQATLAADGSLVSATIPAQNARYVRGPATVGALPGQKSYAPPAGAPYTAQEVSFRTPAGITLRGTLTVPQHAAGARVPAVVTITGSGPQDRDASIAGIPAYRPYYQLADTLGRRGIAVLRLDDRGAGSDAGPATVTTADFADDIRAAVAWLRTRPEIDGRRIGLVGHSEGGTIGPMVAASDTSIGAVVVMAGAVSSGREILEFQQRYVVDSMAHLLGQQREAALAQYRRNTDSVANAMPWMKFFVEYEGTATAARVRAPVLVVHGAKDYQVPVSEADKLAAAVRSGGNRDVTVRVFPGLNHLFLPDGGVGFSYEKLPSFALPAEVIGAIADWLVARLGR